MIGKPQRAAVRFRNAAGAGGKLDENAGGLQRTELLRRQHRRRDGVEQKIILRQTGGIDAGRICLHPHCLRHGAVGGFARGDGHISRDRVQLLRQHAPDAAEADDKALRAVQRDRGGVDRQTDGAFGGGNGVQSRHGLAAVEVGNGGACRLKVCAVCAEQGAVSLRAGADAGEKLRNGQAVFPAQVFPLKGGKGQKQLPGKCRGKRPILRAGHAVGEDDAAPGTKLLGQNCRRSPQKTWYVSGMAYTSFLPQCMHFFGKP